MQAGHDDLTEPFELFLPDESTEEVQDEQRSRVFGLDATPFVGFDEACAPVAKNAERLSRPLKPLFPRDGRDGAEGSSPGESKRARRGAIGDVTLAPLVRNRPPREGEAPLSTVIVDDNSRFGYRPGWVIVSLKITNRCKRGLCFTCEKIRLAWNGITMNLVPHGQRPNAGTGKPIRRRATGSSLRHVETALPRRHSGGRVAQSSAAGVFRREVRRARVSPRCDGAERRTRVRTGVTPGREGTPSRSTPPLLQDQGQGPG